MKDIILFFEQLGFSLNKDNSTNVHFYMNKWINDFTQIDAQGNETYISIRLIANNDIREEERFTSFNKDFTTLKITEWELLYSK